MKPVSLGEKHYVGGEGGNTHRGPTSLGAKTSLTDTVVSCSVVPLNSGLDRAKVKRIVVLEAFICRVGRSRGPAAAAAAAKIKGRTAVTVQLIDPSKFTCVYGMTDKMEARSHPAWVWSNDDRIKRPLAISCRHHVLLCPFLNVK